MSFFLSLIYDYSKCFQNLEVHLYKKIKNLLDVLELRKIIPYCLILTLLEFLAVDRLCSRKGVVKVETVEHETVIHGKLESTI